MFPVLKLHSDQRSFARRVGRGLEGETETARQSRGRFQLGLSGKAGICQVGTSGRALGTKGPDTRRSDVRNQRCQQRDGVGGGRAPRGRESPSSVSSRKISLPCEEWQGRDSALDHEGVGTIEGETGGTLGRRNQQDLGCLALGVGAGRAGAWPLSESRVTVGHVASLNHAGRSR